ncbi:MAG: hypothetical protein HYY05_05210, partial [Chloroflexi bacterium]|nr:hypothetical protein [Chloroflexota bacterium]
GQTSRHAVWAAGDNVRGADLVSTALADAGRAARAIDGFVQSLTRSTNTPAHATPDR